MSLLTRIRRQKAVYWAARGKDENSQYIFELPVEIKVRWVDETVQDLDSEGKPVIFSSHIYVDRVMKNGDMIQLGQLKDLSGAEDRSKAHRVRKFVQTPTLRATQWLYEVYL